MNVLRKYQRRKRAAAEAARRAREQQFEIAREMALRQLALVVRSRPTG
jgi:hypothetical protein